MTQADSVHSTPPTNTPVDTTRRRFLAVAAFASVAGAGSLFDDAFRKCWTTFKVRYLAEEFPI
jgi:hypothetical protein